MTHELKQPLALIGGYAQTAYDYYDSLTYAEEMHCLRVIIERTSFLASLVEDLLDISMLEMGRDTPEVRGGGPGRPGLRKAAEQHHRRRRDADGRGGLPPHFPT